MNKYLQYRSEETLQGTCLRMGTEWIQNGYENVHGTGTERIQNSYENANGTGTEWERNGYKTGTRTCTERERNGNRTSTRMQTEQERNGYRTGTRTQTEWVQNRYRTEMEQIQNGCESQKWKKAFSRTQTIRECSLEHLLVSLIRYHSPYQGFGNDVTLNTRFSNFCPAWRS